MTRHLLAAVCLCLVPPAVRAQPKEGDLAAKLAALEKRVADLEAALKKAPPVDPSQSETAAKVVGNWVVTDEDRKECVFTDLMLKADGKCEFVPAKMGPLTGSS